MQFYLYKVAVFNEERKKGRVSLQLSNNATVGSGIRLPPLNRCAQVLENFFGDLNIFMVFDT